MKKPPKLLMTGASGFTGQHACDYFFKAGYEVTGVTRSQFSYPQIQVEQCDLLNKEAVINLVKKTKPQYLLHLAGQNHVGQSWSDPASTLEANFLSTLYLIEALRLEQPDCRIVIVGSALQFDLADLSTLNHPYSFSKSLQVLAAQAWAKLYGLEIMIAKPSNLVGPGFSRGVCSVFAEKIAKMEEGRAGANMIEVHNLGAQRDFIDVRDVVKAYEIILRNGKAAETYEISSGKSCSIGEIMSTMKKLTPIKFKIKTQKHLNEDKVAIYPNKIVHLGWRPTILMQTSLEDTLNFYRKMKRNDV